MDKEYREGAASVQLALVLLLALAIGLFFLLEGQIERIIWEINGIARSYPEVALRMGNRLLLWLVGLNAAVALLIGLYLLRTAAQARAEEQMPPSGLPVAFRTEIKRGPAALKAARQMAWLGWLLCLLPLLLLLGWFYFSGGLI